MEGRCDMSLKYPESSFEHSSHGMRGDPYAILTNKPYETIGLRLAHDVE